MITQQMTLFDSTKKAIEGTASFRVNASYSWSWLIEHTIEQNVLIEQINSTKTEINNYAIATAQNAEIATTKADESVQARNQAVQAKEEALSVIAVLENGTINDSTIGLNKVYSNQKVNDLLEGLDLSNIDETTTLKHFTAILKEKLDAIADEANNYTHPEAHSPSIITQDSNNRFVSDTEKENWNNKANINNTNLTGTPTATTPPLTDDSTRIATTEFIKDLVGGSNAFTQSLTANGYVKLASGLIIQWGKFGSGISPTFPIAFPNACMSFTYCSSTGGNPFHLSGATQGVASLLKTGASVWSSGGDMYYIAIGY